MKKLKVLGLVAASACMVALTSCLDGGSNNYQRMDYALVDFSTKSFRTLVYPMNDYPLYLSAVANDASFKAGDCIIVNYEVDLKSVENDAASANGFYVSTGTASAPIETATLRFSTMDETPLENELLMSNGGIALLVSENLYRLLALNQHTSLQTNQKNSYSFFFDSNQTPEKVENVADRVYTVYVRCQKTEDGTAPTISGMSEARVMDAAQFYGITKGLESAAGNDVVYYQLKYPETFNADTTAIKTWGTSTVSSFSIKSYNE